jgi:hypothetical protein
LPAGYPDPAADGEALALVGAPAFEAALLAELAARGCSGARAVAPGIVVCASSSASLADSDLAFARQVLPAPHEVRGESVAQLARAALDHALPALLAAAPAPWRLDAIAPDDAELEARAELCGRVLVEQLGERARKVARSRLEAGPAPLVLQLLLGERDRALVSA